MTQTRAKMSIIFSLFKLTQILGMQTNRAHETEHAREQEELTPNQFNLGVDDARKFTSLTALDSFP
jgi:hypothetical protein